MYQSLLMIELGRNPDHPRPGRLWLRNRYHVHQRLCMAFPSALRKSEDGEFLKPFVPGDFAGGQVHVERDEDSGFLFRIDAFPNARAMIVVQSAAEPDWDYAFHNAGYLLAAAPEVKAFEPRFAEGQQFRFRLAANPTRRLSRNSPDAREESVGKRVPVGRDQYIGWLTRRGEAAGFSIDEGSITHQSSYVYMNKKKDGKGQRLCCVLFDGVLHVTDADAFSKANMQGIGSGKAFGFGLLSLAPYPTQDSVVAS